MLTAPAAAFAAGPQLAILPGNAQTASAIDMLVIGPANSRVDLFEQVGTTRQPIRSVTLGPGIDAGDGRILGFASVPAVVPWRCDRQTRNFVATGTAPTGAVIASAGVKSRSCRKQFELTAPPSGTAGSQASVRLTDSFGLGGSPQLCVTPPAQPAACQTVAVGAGGEAITPVSLSKAGLWKVELRTFWQTTTRTIAAGVAPPQAYADPVVALYGDSIMSQLSVPIEDGLPAATTVDFNLRGGAGLFAPSIDWVAQAAARTKALDPQVSAILVGAGEASHIRHPTTGQTVVCCDTPAWEQAYAIRAYAVLQAMTARGGRAVWVINPAAKDGGAQEILGGIERAARYAASLVPRSSVVDLGDVLSPGNRWTDSIQVNLLTRVKVRHEDGLHLTLAGADMGAAPVRAALGPLTPTPLPPAPVDPPPVDPPPVDPPPVDPPPVGPPPVDAPPAGPTAAEILAWWLSAIPDLPQANAPPVARKPAQKKPAAKSCARLSAGKRQRCEVSRRVKKSCARLKGRRKSACVRRVRALARCDSIRVASRRGRARKRACVRRARAIGASAPGSSRR